MKPEGVQSVSVRVPASTANLGAGFDCIGLALKLYLTVRAQVVLDAADVCKVSVNGEGADELPSNQHNLIFRAMRFTAKRERLNLPPVELEVHNELPLARGLGSSATAIVAGVTLASLVCRRELTADSILRYAVEMEGHADNVATAFLGGLVVSCVKPDGSVLAVKRPWPSELKVIVVSPEALLNTAQTRSVLPVNLQREDAVFNLQRVALFGAAIESGDYDLLWDAMQDRLHQAHRQLLVPGLKEALATPAQPGLVGVALSGSGPSVVALARTRAQEIGEQVAENFRRRGVPATVRVLEADHEGAIHF
ncbi:MAG TPA: homoserine kinase [Pyrinomonadaceae bacterium]|nr:homoserine kinase [Pyrinomonadaceae bacterium]